MGIFNNEAQQARSYSLGKSLLRGGGGGGVLDVELSLEAS